MKVFLLLLSILIPFICFATEKPTIEKTPTKVFIVLNVDHTIVDKITPQGPTANNESASKLVEKGLLVQNFEFYSKKEEDPLFELYKTKKNSQMLVEIESEDKIKISEMIAIRPSISDFLHEITKLKLPTHILICPRGNNDRAKSIVNSLKLDINEKPFKDAVDFVSGEKCRAQIKSISSHKTGGKSAWQLRKKYNGKFGRIKKDDYVVSIDQLPNHRFIYSNPEKDLNINLPPFYSKNYETNTNNDKKNMDLALKKIKEFIKK
ncbi:MAG: hypothetical protein N4A31_04410 [Rickettsiales bacterium]|jgi:hypothetical protein|nr:hypothetical protein [Rickettsiales bacterium]